MIEITHAQARRLLREMLEMRDTDRRRLPEGQWSALQAHLEGCPACREYREQLNGLEKALRRSTRAALDVLPPPPDDLPVRVQETRGRRKHARHHLVAVGLPLLLALLLLAAASPLSIPVPEPSAAEAQARIVTPEVPLPTQLPTAQAGSFPAVVAYEARRNGSSGGDSEIYLLNPGSDPVSLSNHPAQDTDPAWSPDGQWLAFLSDRPTPDQPQGKVEVYVVSLANGEILRLTAEPGLVWQGPLSWSPDGEWIALSAVRKAQGDQQWVYLVPVDAQEEGSDRPVALPGSRGGWSPEFSPYGNQLAYAFSDNERSGLVIYHLERGERARTSWPSNPLITDPQPGSFFDWAYDGAGLAYIAGDYPQLASGEGSGEAFPSVPGLDGTAGAGGSRVLAVRALDQSLSLLDDPENSVTVARSHWSGAYRSVTWMPRGTVVYLEDLADARARGNPQSPASCLTLQTWQRSRSGGDESNYSYGSLCVEGGLDRASWTPDGRWLVTRGRLSGENTRSLFAVRVPGGRFDQDDDDGEITLLRLTDDTGVNSLPRVRPRLGRNRQPLNIEPGEGRRISRALPPSDLSHRPGGPQGHIVYSIRNQEMGMVLSSNPDGTGGWVLYAEPGVSRCPRWSPDGRYVALAHREPKAGDGSAGVEELHVVDSSGVRSRRVTRTSATPGVSLPEEVEYGCPVWSPTDTPGGPFLATVIHEPGGWLLGLISTQGEGSRYALIGQPLPGMQPQWSPDGGSLYLAASLPGESVPRLLRVDLPEDDRSALRAVALAVSDRLENLSAFALAPDGRSILVMERPPGQYSPVARIRRVQLAGSGVSVVAAPVRLRPYNMNSWVLKGDLRWLDKNVLGVMLHSETLRTYKAGIYRYDLNSREVRGLAGVEDRVNALAWSPDGRWLVYSSESGLWGLDVSGSRKGQVGPAWLSPLSVEDLDWR